MVPQSEISASQASVCLSDTHMLRAPLAHACPGCGNPPREKTAAAAGAKVGATRLLTSQLRDLAEAALPVGPSDRSAARLRCLRRAVLTTEQRPGATSGPPCRRDEDAAGGSALRGVLFLHTGHHNPRAARGDTSPSAQGQASRSREVCWDAQAPTQGLAATLAGANHVPPTALGSRGPALLCAEHSAAPCAADKQERFTGDAAGTGSGGRRAWALPAVLLTPSRPSWRAERPEERRCGGDAGTWGAPATQPPPGCHQRPQLRPSIQSHSRGNVASEDAHAGKPC